MSFICCVALRSYSVLVIGLYVDVGLGVFVI